MKKIYLLLLFIMIMWGFNVSAISVLVSVVDPILLTAIRIFIAGITVLFICYAVGIFRLPTKNEVWLIIYISIFNVMANHSFLAVGLKYTSTVNAGIILGLGPLITMLFSILMLSQKMTLIKVFGFVVGFTGVILTTLSGSNGLTFVSLGDFLVFISVAAQAFSFILISKLKPSFDPRLFTGYMMAVGSVFIMVFSLLLESNVSQLTNLLNWKYGLILLYSSVASTALGHMFYNIAIKKIGPSESAIFINLNTFFAVLGAAIFLKEPIFINHFIGLLLIVIGVMSATGALDHIFKKKKIHQK